MLGKYARSTAGALVLGAATASVAGTEIANAATAANPPPLAKIVQIVKRQPGRMRKGHLLTFQKLLPKNQQAVIDVAFGTGRSIHSLELLVYRTHGTGSHTRRTAGWAPRVDLKFTRLPDGKWDGIAQNVFAANPNRNPNSSNLTIEHDQNSITGTAGTADKSPLHETIPAIATKVLNIMENTALADTMDMVRGQSIGPTTIV